MTFAKIKCGKCRNEQNVSLNAASTITCLVCNEPLVTPRGGKGTLTEQASIVEELA